jgi:NAD(P)-dependent dehydrogenase (short-subunit alcohol dehydrogenase family)
MDLAAKVAIITGSGGKRSGRAEARRLGAEGCHVVVSDIDEAEEIETARLVRKSEKGYNQQPS